MCPAEHLTQEHCYRQMSNRCISAHLVRQYLGTQEPSSSYLAIFAVCKISFTCCLWSRDKISLTKSRGKTGHGDARTSCLTDLLRRVAVMMSGKTNKGWTGRLKAFVSSDLECYMGKGTSVRSTWKSSSWWACASSRGTA